MSRVRSLFAVVCLSSSVLVACGGSEPAANPAASGGSSAAVAPAPAPPAAVSQPVDREAPCTWVSAAEINQAVGTTFDEGTAKSDDARQIRTCNYQQTSPFAIVDIGLSLTPGADAYQTNWDLAPAYFDGDPRAIELAGAEKAYIIRKKESAWIVGVLVNGRFALVQIAVDSATEAQAKALAGAIATRMK